MGIGSHLCDPKPKRAPVQVTMKKFRHQQSRHQVMMVRGREGEGYPARVRPADFVAPAEEDEEAGYEE